MKKIFGFALLMMFLVGNVLGQPTPSATPPSPESQGIQIPQASSSLQAPPSSESDQALIATSEASARAAAPSFGAIAPSYGETGPSYGSTTPSYSSIGPSAYESTYLVVPPGVSTPNAFYAPYVPSTVAGCYLGQWLPMWMDVRGRGPLYSYEWYPNGRLDTRFLAYLQYPGWQKMWFIGDATGWHILQYYCNGWSNYIYIYVYPENAPGYRDFAAAQPGRSSGYRAAPTPPNLGGEGLVMPDFNLYHPAGLNPDGYGYPMQSPGPQQAASISGNSAIVRPVSGT